jgi:hypothetical protein
MDIDHPLTDASLPSHHDPDLITARIYHADLLTGRVVRKSQAG